MMGAMKELCTLNAGDPSFALGLVIWSDPVESLSGSDGEAAALFGSWGGYMYNLGYSEKIPL